MTSTVRQDFFWQIWLHVFFLSLRNLLHQGQKQIKHAQQIAQLPFLLSQHSTINCAATVFAGTACPQKGTDLMASA